MAQFDPRKLGHTVKKSVKILGTEIEVGLRLLSSGQEQDSVFAAEEYFKTHKIQDGVAPGYLEKEYIKENAIQDIFRFTVDPQNVLDPATGKPHRFFNAPEDIRKNLTTEQIRDLAEKYLEYKEEVMPVDLTDEQIDRLKKNIDRIPMETLSRNTL